MPRTHADPAPRPDVADAGSRRTRVLPVLVVGVLVAACVRGLLVESFVVPSAALAPTVQPGDRVLVWKANPQPAPGDLVVVDTGETSGAPDPSTGSWTGRLLGAVADGLGVRTGSDELAVAAGSDDTGVRLSAPEPTTVAAEDVVGVAVLRFWPLSRFGTVGGATP